MFDVIIMPDASTLDRAIGEVKQAIELDTAGSYEQAYPKYLSACK